LGRPDLVLKLSGKSYERQVMHYLTDRDPRAVFELDVKLFDSQGGHLRQIDIWLPRNREIVECKHQIRPVDVGVVDRLVGTVDDLKASGHE
jgi:hypothetical protein